MKNYEITFITKEDKREKPIKAVLEKLGGKILNVSSLGQKTFAFPIKKEKSGFYTILDFEIEPEKVVDLNKKLGLEEEILRFLMIAAKPAAPRVEMPTKVKETEVEPESEKEKVIKAKEEKPKVEQKPVKKTKEVEKPAFAKTTADKPKKVSKKVKELIDEPVSEEERLDALDKKLEELLKE